MSDSPQGPGWWQASDGKWYPPESSPGGSPTPATGGTAPGTEPQVGEALTYGWEKFQANIGGLIVAALIGFAILAVLTIIGWIGIVGAVVGSSGGYEVNEVTGRVTYDSGPGFFVTAIAYAVFFGLYFLGYMLFDMLMIRVGLLTTAGEKPEPSKILSTDNLGGYIVGTLIMGVIIIVGFALCYFPGLIALLFFGIFGRFFGYYIFDKGMAPVDAIKASIVFVKDNFGKVFVFLLAVMVINWIGSILCGIGLLVTMPVTAIATAYFYKRFDGQPVTA